MGEYAKRLNSVFAEPQEAIKTPGEIETLTELQEHIQNEYDRKRKRPRFEDTHVRTTFLLDRQLAARMNTLCAGRGRGFKTLVYNKTVAAILREFEGGGA